jgi:hypothetical protein
MSLRIFFPAAALVAALAPSMSQASPVTQAMKVCARAFESSLTAGAVNPPVFKLKYAERASSPWESRYNPKYSFYLRATDPKTGLPHASATCSTSLNGDLIALTATPVAERVPTPAAPL